MKYVSTLIYLIISGLLVLGSFNTFAEKVDLSKGLSLRNADSYQQNYVVGGQPSQQDLELLAKRGVKLVINLRSKGEFKDFDEQAVVESLGMKYINISVGSTGDVNFDNVALFNQALNENSGKVLVHCASGNRVGAFFALNAFKYQQKSSTEAIAIGKATGLKRLETKVNSLIGK